MEPKEKALWEIRNEKNKAGVRWFIILLIVPYLSYLLYSGKSVEIGQAHIFNWIYVLTVASFIIGVNLIVTLILIQANKKGFIHPSIKYYTMIADFFPSPW